MGHGRLRTDALGNCLLDFIYPVSVPDSGSLLLEFLFLHGGSDASVSLRLPHGGNPLLLACRGEGGGLFSGGRASVAVTDIHGHPVSTAVLVGSGGAVVDSLHTDARGVAVWEVPPGPGGRYTLDAGGGRGRLAVDAVAPSGYTLRVLGGPGGHRAEVHNHGVSGEALLVVRSVSSVVWSHFLSVPRGGSASVGIPSGVVPVGVWSVAVFDASGRFHSERLFVDGGGGAHRVSVETDRVSYGGKGKVTVRIGVTDSGGVPVVADLSVSATGREGVDSGSVAGILDAGRYGFFPRGLRSRLWGVGSDGLLLGLHWPGRGWGEVLSGGPAPPRVPGTGGTTGRVVGMRNEPDIAYPDNFVPARRDIRKVRLHSVSGVHFTEGGFEPVVEHRTVEVDPESGTFFIPDSLLVSRAGQEWLLDIPRVHNAPWDYQYLVEWQDPDIAFDSTIVRGGQLYRPPVLGRFATSAVPGAAAFGFRGSNLLGEVVVGRKDRPVRRTLRKTDCELYEEMLRKDDINKHWNLIKGHTHPWGYTYSGGAKVIMYLGCGRYRDIGYIRNITVPGDFPLPDYGVSPSAVEDTRSTVYWNPGIVTGADGTATFSFYTSDMAGDYTITVEGLDVRTLAPVSGEGGFKVITR